MRNWPFFQLLPSDGIKIYGPESLDEHSAVISFTMGDAHPHDISTILDMEGVAVQLGVHGDTGDPQLLAGANHPNGDLPAVGDQYLAEHVLGPLGGDTASDMLPHAGVGHRAAAAVREGVA